MKLVVFACLLALALARPQDPATANTLRSENINEGLGDGVFNYAFETDQGIAVEANGTPGVEGQSNIAGIFRFPLGDGRTLEVEYVADEAGYRPRVTLS